jgi:hypothetical protein
MLTYDWNQESRLLFNPKLRSLSINLEWFTLSNTLDMLNDVCSLSLIQMLSNRAYNFDTVL